MRVLSTLAIVAAATSSIAFSQVGPNPAANGSLDPTVGRGTDTATAPDDAAVGSSVRDGTVADPLPVPDNATDANATASDNSTNRAPMSPPAAATKKSTAPTSESARKPR
jgi:hypothetical protein